MTKEKVEINNRIFTLDYNELIFLLKEAYRNGYASYEMVHVGLEPFNSEGYAKSVLTGLKYNKQTNEKPNINNPNQL